MRKSIHIGKKKGKNVINIKQKSHPSDHILLCYFIFYFVCQMHSNVDKIFALHTALQRLILLVTNYSSINLQNYFWKHLYCALLASVLVVQYVLLSASNLIQLGLISPCMWQTACTDLMLTKLNSSLGTHCQTPSPSQKLGFDFVFPPEQQSQSLPPKSITYKQVTTSQGIL